ncbi:alpha/beta-hydrolase [Pleurotus eryngii]|uniref:Alpha/beta-hydrolase n=1 Tax=Pleurotus eryngii TaxID=5323 RepID=A0A9P6A411_PLEER|nr:alpha/beta-hydrolase [Pleurotus eryngii]
MQPSQSAALEERKVVSLSNGGQLELELKYSRNPDSRKLAVCLHPWSWLGGRMDDPVLHSLVVVLEKHEYHILRYNSRGVGASKGWPSLTGHTEGKDLEALVQWALQTIPELRSIVLLGYSHGSLIASLHPLLPPPVKISHILLSYPLGARMFLTLFNSGSYASKLKELVENPASNLLIIYGDQDEFTGASRYDEWTKSLSSETSTLKVVKVEGGSHFWKGRANNTLQKEIDHWLAMF